ncbi:pyridoxamine 5'-phosphate oxidase [Terasakiella sp. SH-1]|uniref:pyridoxamine 5'-phosphate oxidase n=1 Tax=Terasakiella sp. SH-1 TaxID=2560057 RepID=UPI00107394D4|nr:pyridoxamine 5'-phosphate oxidase [Terasakiella sp. SH-1]
MKEAEESEINDPNAMSLATATKDGVPSVRMVLLKGADEDGFVFYTNLGSRKAEELLENPHAALCLHWKSLRKQVRVEGAIEPVSEAEADEYFHSRARVSRIGAWASKQSQEMEGRWELEKRVAEFTAKFGIGDIPRPEFWSGFRLKPRAIEFWSDQKFRLHDRVVYSQLDGDWVTKRLFP